MRAAEELILGPSFSLFPPPQPEALWCLGNAVTSKGFLLSDSKQALALFTVRRPPSPFSRAFPPPPGQNRTLCAPFLALARRGAECGLCGPR